MIIKAEVGLNEDTRDFFTYEEYKSDEMLFKNVVILSIEGKYCYVVGEQISRWVDISYIKFDYESLKAKRCEDE